MTKKQFIQKVRRLNRLNSQAILDRAVKALKSGCMDLEAADDNYLLPKAFMTAACREMGHQWKPFDKASQKQAKNIELFLWEN